VGASLRLKKKYATDFCVRVEREARNRELLLLNFSTRYTRSKKKVGGASLEEKSGRRFARRKNGGVNAKKPHGLREAFSYMSV
jgi:hypothetical protein